MLDLSLVFDGTFTGTPAVATGVAITNSRASTNILDLLVARDVGAGEDLSLHVLVNPAFTTTNSATLEIDFQVSPDTTSGDFVTIMSSPVYPAAQLIAGSPLFRYRLPVNQLLNATAGVLAAPGRYLRLNYNVGTGV